MNRDNETNQGLLFGTFKKYAPELLEFEKLNHEYFKNDLTKSDVNKIVSYMQLEDKVSPIIPCKQGKLYRAAKKHLGKILLKKHE